MKVSTFHSANGAYIRIQVNTTDMQIRLDANETLQTIAQSWRSRAADLTRRAELLDRAYEQLQKGAAK